MIINVNLRREIDNSYNIIIGKSLNKEIVSFLKKLKKDKIGIICDNNIRNLFGNTLKKDLKNSDINSFIFSFPPGEKYKNRKIKEKIEDELLNSGFGRDSIIISFGGGVVGDIAGFVASTFNRGIPYIQVPTSFLAMIDSSIGGKTGVDTMKGKNLIGSFHQPIAVFIDIDYLEKLPENELINGCAELIKYGIIYDKKLFNYIENNVKKIIFKKENVILHCIAKSCQIKANIVEEDEKESEGKRQILNFGHTIGHAIENLSNFVISHGNAISIGMVVEARISKGFGILSQKDVQRITSIFKKFGLPTTVPKTFSVDDIIKSTKLDKKAKKGIPRYVLISKIGVVYQKNGFSHIVKEELIKRSLNESR